MRFRGLIWLALRLPTPLRLASTLASLALKLPSPKREGGGGEALT